MGNYNPNSIWSIVMQLLRSLVPSLWRKGDRDTYVRETIRYGGVSMTFSSWFYYEEHPFKQNRNYRTRIIATIDLKGLFENFDLIFWMPHQVDIVAQSDQVLYAMLDSVESKEHTLANHFGRLDEIEACMARLLKHRKDTIAAQSRRNDEAFRDVFVDKINPFNGASLQKHE